ncbi:MAG TPA: hypothetical protein VHG28_05475 [Longimicrobiaceae bacterium]|nr:hypothetical protein [Longimicrobiaceae bacterium]
MAALPALAAAQQRPVPQRASQPSTLAPSRSAVTPETQAMYTELMQIGQRLQAAQARAMQDPQLRAAYELLGRDMKAAIERADPSLVGVEARARAMEAEARRAQQAGDQAKLARLMQDAQQIQVKLMSAQQRAIREQPALANRARSFEDQLRRKMIEVEPQTMALLERGKVLQARLVQVAQAQQRTGAPRQ